MTVIKQVVVVAFILLACGTSWGETDKKFSAKQVKDLTRNHTVLTVQKDADMFLYTLNRLNENNEYQVRAFMEYMLDAIVCESWQHKDSLNSHQLEQTMKVFEAIKEYRLQNPRTEEAQVKVEDVSALFPQFDATYADRSRKILAEL